MSNLFKTPIKLKEIVDSLGLSVNDCLDINISSISDSDFTLENSICDYIKGPLPENRTGLILLVKEKVAGFNCIEVCNPQESIAKIITLVKSSCDFKYLYDSLGIAPSVTMGKNVVIENNVTIGENTVIEHNVVIHSGTKIGANCIIRSNAAIGGQGYGFYTSNKGILENFPSLGGVVIGDNVEIGYGCAIVKGTINNTVLHDNVKLDNLIHIAHDCNIGKGSTITAGVSLCGYVRIGQNTRLAPQATVKQRTSIGSNVIVGLGAVVTKNIEDNAIVAGNPARVLRSK